MGKGRVEVVAGMQSDTGLLITMVVMFAAYLLVAIKHY